MNLNKVFPRLSIHAKLMIAFAGLALAPLLIGTVTGSLITIGRIRALAQATLANDLDKAEARTARLLGEAERHVVYLSREVLAEGLRRPLSGSEWDAKGRAVATFLGPEPVFHAIKAVDPDGRTVFAGSAAGRQARGRDDDESAVYYAWRAAAALAGRSALFSIEVRLDSARSAASRVVPAIAVVVPIHEGGRYLGAVVGEAYASQVLGDIEASAPGYEGVTGLVDANGALLFHSSLKREWASLLAGTAAAELPADLPPAVFAALRAGRNGVVRTRDARFVGYRSLRLGGPDGATLGVYRVVPFARLEAPVRLFLLWVLLGAAGLATAALLLGALAARQFTDPLYRLRAALGQLASGGAPVAPAIDTNDEIEDLARDFVAMAAEVTEHRERLEQAVAERTRDLRAAHAEHATVLEGSADAIIGLDDGDRIRVWNHGAESLFGWAEDEVRGRDIAAVIGVPGPEAAREDTYLRRLLEEDGAVVGYATRRRARDGSVIPVSLTHTVVCAGDGCPVGASLVIRDNRLQEQLNDHMRRSERLAAVSVMAAGLAHEINNPLGIVINRIEIMQRDAARRGRVDLREDLGTLADHVARLRSLTTDLLRFAREETDLPGPVRLDQLADRVVALLERTFVSRGLQLTLRQAGPLPPVPGSANALETVLMNLLLNAADASPPDGRVVVETRLADGANAVALLVRDEGRGIPAEVRGRIFEPFFTTKGPRGGTGLGLAVCRTVIDRHGGTIQVESVEGGGSVFTVTLPLEPVSMTV